MFKITFYFGVDFTIIQDRRIFLFFNSPINLYGHSVQVFECFETGTDIVRSVRSGGYAHDVLPLPRNNIFSTLQVQDTRLYFFDICHGTAENFKLNLPGVTERSIMFYKLLDGYLGPRRWFLGERITYVDIMAYDSMSNWLAMKPNMLDGCDNLKGLMKRFEALPNIKKYMESGRYITWPINGKDAHFSFK